MSASRLIPTTRATGTSLETGLITPLFRVPVPIFPSDVADPEKGTGVLMVCTFGDATDVDWWREQRTLALAPADRPHRPAESVDFGSPRASRASTPIRPTAATPRSPNKNGQARRASDRRAASRSRTGSATGGAAPLSRRAGGHRPPGQVLREGRSPARVRSRPASGS